MFPCHSPSAFFAHSFMRANVILMPCRRSPSPLVAPVPLRYLVVFHYLYSITKLSPYQAFLHKKGIFSHLFLKFFLTIFWKGDRLLKGRSDRFGYWKRKSEEESGISGWALRSPACSSREGAPANLRVDLLGYGKIFGRAEKKEGLDPPGCATGICMICV